MRKKNQKNISTRSIKENAHAINNLFNLKLWNVHKKYASYERIKTNRSACNQGMQKALFNSSFIKINLGNRSKLELNSGVTSANKIKIKVLLK